MKSASRIPVGFFLLVAAMVLSVAAYGSDLLWFGNGWDLGGSGNWSIGTDEWNPPKWSPTTDPADLTIWDPTQTAVFSGADGNVDVSLAVTAGAGLRFETGPYYLTGAGNLTLVGPSPAANSIEVASSVTATIETMIAGTDGLTKAGPGTLVLSGANSYSGGTTLSAGTLQLEADDALPASGPFVFAGGTLAANDRSVSLGALSLHASSTLLLGSSVAARQDVTFASAENWVGGDLTVVGWEGPTGTIYDRFLVSADPTASGLLDHIQFSGFAVGATWEAATGEVLPRLSASAELSVTKTDGVVTATAGGSVTYTIVASNAGPANVTGATVADTFPATLTATWTCVGAGGGTCTAAGSGNINDTVNLPAGASVTYTVSATISASATGSLVNTATVTAPGGVTDPTPGNNTATDTDTLAASADLSITKTDGVVTATAGGSVTYTIVASNAGPSNVTGATVADTFPATLTATWTCVGAGGGTCTAAGSGNISDTVNLPAGASVTYTVSATISASATGSLVNTATVTAPGGVTDPTPANNTATDTDTLAASADLSITKTDGSATYTPGGTAVYTIVVTNAGPSNVTGATVADPLPTGITTAAWTCTPSAGSTCAATGTGAIADTVNLLASGTATYTLTLTIPAGQTGSLVNAATVTAPGGVTDPTPGNDTATDTDTLNAQADLVVSKVASTATVSVGNDFEYRISARNLGPSNATNVVLTDPLPAGLLLVEATSTQGSCAGATTVTCSLGLLLPDTQAEIVLTVRAMAPGGFVNTATATLDEVDPTPPNNVSAVPVTAQGQATIPAASETGLLVLALLIAAAGLLRLRGSLPGV